MQNREQNPKQRASASERHAIAASAADVLSEGKRKKEKKQEPKIKLKIIMYDFRSPKFKFN
jgi:hypothetical protein